MTEFVKTDETVLLAEIETDYGQVNTSPNPLPMLTSGFSITPLESTILQRDLDRPGFGADPVLLSGVHVSCNFSVELAGSGMAGDPLPYAAILRGCGRAEETSSGTSAVYAPISDAFESLTLDAHLDGIHHQVTGWRGAYGLSIAAGSLPTLSVQGSGLYVAPDNAAFPVVNFDDFQAPLPVEFSNTVATFGGETLPTVNFSVGQGDQVNYRNLINQEAVTIDGRALTGTMEVLMNEDLTTFDPYTLAKAGGSIDLKIVHGNVAGHILEVDAPQVQIDSVSMGTSGGERTWQLGLRFIATDAGNDELILTAK
ncbi:MAG: phage tail tube protein [Alphaproteobacteria bacterium]